MKSGYLHIDILSRQMPKRFDDVCGDAILQWRTEEATTILLCDGVGSGSSAHIAAILCTSTFKGLLDNGFSFRQAFQIVVKTLEQWKDPQMPYCAISAARILNDGQTTVLAYEAPAPVLVGQGIATVLPQKPFLMEGAIAHEYSCYLIAGEGIVLFSDGISQAGLGRELIGGWGSERVADYLSRLIADHTPAAEYCDRILEKACDLSGGQSHDDATVIYARCRPGRTVTILTGPPSEPAKDAAVVRRFLQSAGAKVVCGATTAAVVAREGNKTLEMEDMPSSLVAPPRYYMEGIDLATEGAVTLNQLCNILDIAEPKFEETNSVTELYDLLMDADRIEFLMGNRKNPGSGGITFCQKGILTREKIVPILADKLRAKGKLVVIHPF